MIGKPDDERGSCFSDSACSCERGQQQGALVRMVWWRGRVASKVVIRDL